MSREKQSKEPSFDNFYILTAFVKSRGVLGLQSAIKKFRKRGGKVFAIAGVDSKGTSKEGLEALHKNANELSIFDDKNTSQSFHPKMYILEKTGKRAFVVIGSNNLTAGGMYTNYELSTASTYDLSDEAQQKEFACFTKVFEMYRTDHALCRSYSSKLLQTLLKKKRIVIERLERIRRETEQKEAGSGGLPFGTHKHKRPPSTPGKGFKVLRRGFWKVLSSNDASKTSSPGQIQIPLRFLHYFPPIGNYHGMPVGSKQGDVFFDVVYRGSNGNQRFVKDVRAIHYFPAPQHKRKNQELRFTFLNRSISDRFKPSDILVFKMLKGSNAWFQISRLVTTQQKAVYSKTGEKFGRIS